MAGDAPPAAPSTEATSRLCVKNLPKYLSDDRLKKHFAVKGEVTDVKVLKTRDGQPRQMGFVGYRTVEEAAAALKYFNNSFIDTSRLTVEFARPFRDAELPRPWSKHSDGSILNQKQQEQQAEPKAKPVAGKKRKAPGPAVDDEAQADPKLAEFLSLMQPRSKARMWSNDDLLPGDVSVKVAPAPAATKPGKRAAPDASADDEPVGDGRPAKRTAQQHQQQHLEQQQQSEQGEGEEEEVGDGQEEGAAALMGKDALVMDSNVGDLDYLRSRMRKWDDDDDGDDDVAEQQPQQQQQQQQQQHAGHENGVLMAAASDSDSDGSSREEESDADDVDSDAEQQELETLRRGEQSGVGTSAPDRQQQQQQQQRKQQQKELEPGMDEEDHEGGEVDRQDGADDVHAPGHASGGGGRGNRGDEGAADGAEDMILDTGRLFVRNLAYGATEADLGELFGRHGDLAEVHLVLDKDTKQSKGLAYVQFQVPEDALSAHSALDSTIFQGRLLHILPARRSLAQEREARATAQQEQQQRQDAAANASQGAHALEQAGIDSQDPEQSTRKGPSFKSEREQQRKKEAGNRSAWNTLFMRADTVAAAVAAHYGVSKAELLDKSAADLPVRMALGEAQVIAQTKAALSEAGVAVDRLEAAAAASGHASSKASVARSASVLLVKNLPFTSDERELGALFGRHGTVVRLVLPPARALALVEYAEPQEARAAFKSLAYKKYQNVPLYLEWAPKDVFLEGASATAKATASATAMQPAAATTTAAASPAVAATAAADEDADEDGPVATLFVKNLSFATTDEALAKHFDKAVSAAGGRLHSARVARRKASDGKLLSMGFGFVECDSEDVAKVVLKQLQGSKLDKHALNLQLSKRRAPRADKAAAAVSKAAAKDGAGAKLVVRNVAFEATKRDIMGLFGPFGHIKSCRLPKKFDGAHRGFAFIEFTTKQEAKAAAEGVGGTHLYGRRLVVEYAEADAEGVDELRAKAGQHAAKARGGGGEAALAAAKRLQATL